jgi:hypothetical protein
VRNIHDEYSPCQLAANVLRLADTIAVRSLEIHLQAVAIRGRNGQTRTRYDERIARHLDNLAAQKEACALRLCRMAEELTSVGALNTPSWPL